MPSFDDASPEGQPPSPPPGDQGSPERTVQRPVRRLSRLLETTVGRALLAIGLGLGNTVALFGWGPLNPRNIEWIFGDNAMYYFAWASYRHDSHVSFPLAWTDRVGYPIGASIAMLDAIPAVAVLLRPLSPLLSEPFQYLGPYSALCFILQAYFGLSLCRRLFPSQTTFTVLGSVFFLLSAPLTWRAFGHTSLLSHWLLLAALDSYFREPGDRPVRWLGRQWIVLAIAAAITPYVAAMCLLITVAAVGRLLLERRCGAGQALLLLAATAAGLLATAVTIGVVVAWDTSTYWAPGYGLFSLNLNSLVNPLEYGSLLLPALPVISPAQVEGYNYLGLGTVALLVLNLVRRPRAILRLGERRMLPLVGLALICTAIALSTTVSFGSSTLFTIDVPTRVLAALQSLRASGRMFWPVYYLITAAALALTFTAWKAPYRLLIVAAALAIQVADLTPLRTKVRAVVDQRFPSELRSPLWKGLGQQYDNLVLLPPFQCGPYTGAGGIYSYVTFGKLAGGEGMRSNSYPASRHTRPELFGHCVELLRTQLAGTLDARSAYVVTDGVRTVWALHGMRSHSCQLVDGYNLCTLAAAAGTPGSGPPTAAAAAPYTIGEELDFTQLATRRFLTLGWSEPLPDGRWTEGPMAMVRLGFDAPAASSRPLMLDVVGRAFVEAQHLRLYVDVVVNDEIVDQWTFRATGPGFRRTVRIPAALAAGRRGIDLELRFRNPDSPLYLGTGPSSNFLGVNVQSMTLRYE